MAPLLASLVSEPIRPALWLAALLTYAVHAVVWAAAAAWLSRRKALSPSAQHSLWKTALLGPIVSALLAAVLASWGAARFTHAAFVTLSPREYSVLTLAVPAAAGELPGAAASAVVARETVGSGATWRAAEPCWRFLGACAFGASVLGVLGFCGSAFGLRRRLRSRTRVRDARVLGRLARLRQRLELGALTLSESPSITSPLVLGMAEICLPQGLSRALTDAELDAVLAHELAHLERRDGVWFPMAALLQAALWFQPLNHWVLRRFRQTAELACDDRAVELTADPLALARALVQVAERALPPGESALAPTMATAGGALVVRVKRLTATRGLPPSAGKWGRSWAMLSLAAIGAATASFGVRAAPPSPSPSPQARLARAAASIATGDEAVGVPPDVAAESAAMAALARREHELAEAVQRAANEPEAEKSGTPAAVRELELEQELGHVRAMAAFREQRFSEQSAAWEARRLALARAVR